MLQKDGCLFSNDMEDIRIIKHQFRVIARLVDGVVQIVTINLADLHKIPFCHEADLLKDIFLLINPQFGCQHTTVVRDHALVDLETDYIGKFTVAQGRLDHNEKIVGGFLPTFGNGVSGAHGVVLQSVAVLSELPDSVYNRRRSVPEATCHRR